MKGKMLVQTPDRKILGIENHIWNKNNTRQLMYIYNVTVRENIVAVNEKVITF